MSAPEPGPLDPMVTAMCEKYRYEEAHCRRVAGLSLRLFDLLSPLHGLGDADAALLCHAAYLHDIGHFISYRGHHRHGEYLIRHDSALAGYPEKERELVAWLARSHRKRPVAPPARRTGAALQLAAMLRLADGLDHDRTGNVSLLAADITARKLRLTVSGLDTGALADLLRDKALLIRPAFGRKLSWEPAP